MKKPTKKKQTRLLVDPVSPDGWRCIMSATDWKKERERLAEIAHNLCEGCETPHFLPFGPSGQAHHLYGRGGGRRDDRSFVPLQTIETEPNLARWRYLRNLVWTCVFGHDRLERLSTKSYRQSLAQYCECGLLRI